MDLVELGLTMRILYGAMMVAMAGLNLAMVQTGVKFSLI